MWERFSFYGMQALLLLYMTKYLLLPENARHVLGLDAARTALAHVFGAQSDLAFATLIYGTYSGLIYFTPLLGAWLGDRIIGKRMAVTLGCLLMTAGHFAMAFESLFLIALLLISLGAGGVVGNMAAQVGLLYAPEDNRRTRAFGIYLITLNIGFLLSPLIIGTLGEKVGWHWGFGAAGIGMLIGLAIYLFGQSSLPEDRIAPRAERMPLTPRERAITGKLLWLYLPYMLSNIPAFMAYGLMYVWADKVVDLNIGGFEVPVTWIGIVDGLFTIGSVWLATRIWAWLEVRGREPHDIDKLLIGYGILGIAWLYAAAIALLPQVPVLLWIGFFLILDLSFGWNEAPMSSIVSRMSPKSITATMMALTKVSVALAYFSIGSLGELYEPLGAPMFWLLTGGFAFAAAALILLMRGPLKRAFGDAASLVAEKDLHAAA